MEIIDYHLTQFNLNNFGLWKIIIVISICNCTFLNAFSFLCLKLTLKYFYRLSKWGNYKFAYFLKYFRNYIKTFSLWRFKDFCKNLNYPFDFIKFLQKNCQKQGKASQKRGSNLRRDFLGLGGVQADIT